MLVDGARLPRTKLGSVPYALEAGHASTAALDTAGARQRICTGATPAATTAWQVYAAGPNIFVDVDTTRCGFTKPPRYFTSLGGSTSHGTTMGATSIYSATNTGFRIHIDAVQDMTPDLARMQQWYIQWIAVGE